MAKMTLLPGVGYEPTGGQSLGQSLGKYPWTRMKMKTSQNTESTHLEIREDMSFLIMKRFEKGIPIESNKLSQITKKDQEQKSKSKSGNRQNRWKRKKAKSQAMS